MNELKIYLKFPNDFHPLVKIRIYKNTVSERQPYTFELSHHVKTPTQAGPYFPSITNSENAADAIDEAIKALTKYIKGAIAEGHQPSQNWLIANENW